MLLQERRDASRIGRCRARPQRERPQTALNEKARERVGGLPERVGLLADRVGERLATRDHTRYGVAVSGQVLGGGVDHEIGAVLERAEQCRPEERVVGDEQQVVAPGDRRHGIEIGHPQARVGRGLEEQRARRRPGRGFDGREIGHVDRRDTQAASREVVLQEDLGDREQLVADDDVIARAEVGEERGRDRGHAGG
jgi:hypothetical protein